MAGGCSPYRKTYACQPPHPVPAKCECLIVSSKSCNACLGDEPHPYGYVRRAGGGWRGAHGVQWRIRRR